MRRRMQVLLYNSIIAEKYLLSNFVVTQMGKTKEICTSCIALYVYTRCWDGFPGRVAFANFRTRSIIKCDTSTVTRESLILC